MDTADVVVVGAGPTGLMLACELALGGAAVRVLEERASTPNITRAFAVHARTLELLDSRGLAEDLIPRTRRAIVRGAEVVALSQDGDGITVECAGRSDIVHVVGTHPELPDAVLVRPDSYVAWAESRMPSAAELVASVDDWLVQK